jgi:hypothetical protein
MVLMIDNHPHDIINVWVGLCPPFMGTFDYLPTYGDVKLISVVPNQPRDEIFQVLSFRTTYFYDLWTLPSPSMMIEGTRNPGMAMPLFVTEFVYIIFQQASTNPDQTPAH